MYSRFSHHVHMKALQLVQCGSCWAFSGVSMMESAFMIQKGLPAMDLAEQDFVECAERASSRKLFCTCFALASWCVHITQRRASACRELRRKLGAERP